MTPGEQCRAEAYARFLLGQPGVEATVTRTRRVLADGFVVEVRIRAVVRPGDELAAARRLIDAANEANGDGDTIVRGRE